ncbi:MAG TPA: serine/threonine-protein kinase [Ideonella sp.]|uniref:serine/threonine protein kinase n=1 Tax=Ideonella sp. TaxID=1929293 RepID=UPI002E35975C|nr:serine/threonine-protein kinase [Ideonella sp.]HEX5683108.1 serine/threonine-protein kinase [Ideonella sp.]
MRETPEDKPRTQDLPPADELNALPAGTPFGALEILRTVGVGGFGIVYLAQDHALQRLVAVKEYMPGQLAQRGTGSQVSLRSSSHQETFEVGRRSFVNEARLLARFDHRSLLKVYQFWEANGTAYMAMPFLQGKTLKQVRQAMAGPPNEAYLLKVLLPLLDGLRLLHGESVYHRDIAPDNILLPDGGGDPILLDFGAARHAIGDRTQMFTAILKPSFAPIEQYGEAVGLRQGPWTDLFALGAVAHYLILGRPPPAATTRAVSDGYQPLAGMALPGLSTTVLAAIDWALRVRPQDRPQTVDEMRAALMGEIKPPPLQQPMAAAEPERAEATPDPTGYDATVPLSRALAAAALAKSMPAAKADRPAAKARSASKRPSGSAKPSAARPGGAPWLGPAMLWGGAAVLAVAAVGWWWSGSGEAPTDEPVVDEAAVQTAAVSPSTTAVPGPAAVAPPPAAQAPAAAARTGNPQGAVGKPVPPESFKPAPVRDALVTPVEPRPIPVTRPTVGVDTTSTPGSTTTTGVTGAADPRAACGKKVFLAMTLCIDRLCRKPAYAGAEECVKLRELRDQREQQRH